MKTVEEINSYLEAVALVNSIHARGFIYSFKLMPTKRMSTVLDTLIEFEKTSDDYEGYDLKEYELEELKKPIEELTEKLSKLFMEYAFWVFDASKIDSDNEKVDKLRVESLNKAAIKNKDLLSTRLVSSIFNMVGSNSKVFTIDVKQREDMECYSVFDITWGEVFLILNKDDAYILEISGTD